MKVLTIILAGGHGVKLSALTALRQKPALPFGGKYRVIDFVLSNIAHSGLNHVAVVTQNHPHPLIEHLGNGESWGLKDGYSQVWLPSIERTGTEEYIGTADAVYQNRRGIAELGCDLTLIVAGDQIYFQDYRDMLRFHQKKGAVLTIATLPVPLDDVHSFGIVNADENQKISWFIEKPPSAQTRQGSKGIYVFDTETMLRYLDDDSRNPDSSHDFGRDVIPRFVESGQAYAYPFTQYWADIGSVVAYWKTNLALLGDEPMLSLCDPAWPLLTRTIQKPPAIIRPAGNVMNSLVCDGCVIEGEVMHSILSPGVRVERGAIVRDAVILHDTVIRAGAALRGCVVDQEVDIGADAQIGAGGDMTPNQTEPKNLKDGITVVGKGAHIPAGLVIGHNCRIDPWVGPEDFEAMGLAGQTHLASGTTVRKVQDRQE